MNIRGYLFNSHWADDKKPEAYFVNERAVPRSDQKVDADLDEVEQTWGTLSGAPYFVVDIVSEHEVARTANRRVDDGCNALERPLSIGDHPQCIRETYKCPVDHAIELAWVDHISRERWNDGVARELEINVNMEFKFEV